MKVKITSLLARVAALIAALNLAYGGLLFSNENDYVIPGKATKTAPVIDGVLDEEGHRLVAADQLARPFVNHLHDVAAPITFVNLKSFSHSYTPFEGRPPAPDSRF